MAYTLLNLLGQHYRKEDFEVVVVDDNSIDGTTWLLKIMAVEFVEGGYNIRILSNERKGASSARNTGISASKGDIIAFADQDVFLPRDWLSEIADKMRSPALAGIYGDLVTDFEKFLEPIATASINKRYLTACCAYRKDILTKVGMFDESFPFFREDSELAYRILSKGYQIDHDPALIAYHPLKKLRLKDLADAFRLSTVDPLLFKIHPDESGKDVFSQVLPRVTFEGFGLLSFLSVLAVMLILLPPGVAALGVLILVLSAVAAMAVVRTSYRGKPPSLRIAGAVLSLLMYLLTVLGRAFGSVKHRTLLI